MWKPSLPPPTGASFTLFIGQKFHLWNRRRTTCIIAHANPGYPPITKMSNLSTSCIWQKTLRRNPATKFQERLWSGNQSLPMQLFCQWDPPDLTSKLDDYNCSFEQHASKQMQIPVTPSLRTWTIYQFVAFGEKHCAATLWTNWKGEL